MLACPGCKRDLVAIEHTPASRLDQLTGIQLFEQKCRQNPRGQIARADVAPSVLVDQAAVEARAIGAFFANDLGALGEALVIDQERAAFAAGEVLGLVEALRTEHADRAQKAAFVA